MAEDELRPGQDFLGLLATTGIPEIRWEIGDDLCDCVFQRIGFWTNPYMARTLKVRFCCIWTDIMAQHPEHVQEIPAYMDPMTGLMKTEPLEWDSEDSDMPRSLWYRQLAVKYRRPIAEIREKCESLEPPKMVAKGTRARMKGADDGV